MVTNKDFENLFKKIAESNKLLKEGLPAEIFKAGDDFDFTSFLQQTSANICVCVEVIEAGGESSSNMQKKITRQTAIQVVHRVTNGLDDRELIEKTELISRQFISYLENYLLKYQKPNPLLPKKLFSQFTWSGLAGFDETLLYSSHVGTRFNLSFVCEDHYVFNENDWEE